MKMRPLFARMTVPPVLLGSPSRFCFPGPLAAADSAPPPADAKSPAPSDTKLTTNAEPHRSPIALALSADGARLLVANQTSGTVSLIDTKSNKVLHELATGDKPAGVALSSDGRRAAVTHWYGYDVALLDLVGDRVKITGRIPVGPEPRGVAMTRDGATLFVAVGVSNQVVRIDADSKKITGQLDVGREPRGAGSFSRRQPAPRQQRALA